MSKDSFNVTQSNLPLGDPHICSDSKNRLSLLAAIYNALVSRPAPGVYQQCLAEAWRTSNDARTWEFRLRRGVLFHNAHELCAGDVVANLERIRSPKVGGAFGTQGVYASYLGDAEYEAIGVDRVRISLGEPMADLLDLLVEMPILPEEALDSLPHEHVGSGPYMVNDYDANEVEMVAHRRYWKGKPTYSRVTWASEPEEGERINAVAKGDADVASGLTPEGKALSKAREVPMANQLGGLCVIYLINCMSGPCSDKRVRLALNLALDREAIIERIVDSAAEPLTGPLTPLHFGWDTETPGYQHDPAEAKRLLKDAGYSDGLTLKLDTPSEMPDEAIPLSKMMAEQYREVGITADIRIFRDRPGYAEMVRAKKIGDLCCFDSSPLSTFRVMREKIHSRIQGPWWEGYSNPKVDTLIEQAQRTIDDEERRWIYRKAYRIIRDDAPWVFLYRPEIIWAVGVDVQWEPSWDGVTRID